MKILLTNQHLNLLGGSETFTYTLALALKRAGHEPAVITAETGSVSQMLEREGVEVTDQPETWKDRSFDVIHCHHNLMALVARHCRPDTPMVYLSHGIQPGLEEPPSIDLNIARHIGVSEEVVRYLADSHGIERADLVRNGVDCNRFKPTMPPNEKPKSILVLSNHFTAERLTVVNEAARSIGAEVRQVGLATGSVWEIEQEMNRADIVVSLGRGIIEAMACGRAAFVYDWHGGDGMLTPDNYEEIRRHNFSGRRFRKEFTGEQLAAELATYTASMGETNRRIALEHHDIDKQVSIYEDLYRQAIESTAGSAVAVPGREILFLQNVWRERVAIWRKAVELDGENQKLKRELANIQPRIQSLVQQVKNEKAAIEREKQRLGLTGEAPSSTIDEFRRSVELPERDTYRGENLIFIFGPPRSGTTWLLSLLKEHPHVIAATRKNLGLPDTGERTLETGIFLENSGLSDEEIRDRFHALSSAHPGMVVVEKTPIHVFMAERIKRIFPAAVLALMIRDGRDVVTSMINVARSKDAWWKGAPGNVPDAAEYWKKFAEAGIECQKRFSPYVLRYRDLRAHPEYELATLQKLLGLDLSKTGKQVEASRGGKNIPIKGVYRKGVTGEWRETFSPEDVEAFKRTAGETLIALGYEENQDWDLAE